MNVRDLTIIHNNILIAMKIYPQPNDAYGWTRLLCRQLRVLTTPRDLTGTQEWQRVA